ncbi:MAG: acetylornithine/succinylornithine family transaminase [Planctomycetota bacterium]|nr:acetylornithine/succinylornithine family transaminase [Planctomycetota bacterium]
MTGIVELETRHTSGVYPKRDVPLVRGRGARVWDAEGREFIDCAAGHGVAALGHGHPRVVEAIQRQAEVLITCPETYPNDRRAEYCARLSSLLPGTMERLFLCNSGAEAVEAALKFARLSTGRSKIVAAKRGFHGRTFGALSATWERKYRAPFEPLVPGFEHMAFDDLEAARAAIDEETACVLVEIVQGEGGVHPGSTLFFQGLRRLCDERGALLVIDEVQTGFGRTGRLFACEHHQLEPDLICLGKAIGGGLPMGAVGIGSRVAELPVGAHGTTFGGGPLVCAAALAVLDVLEEERLAERASVVGAWLLDRLRELDYPLVREVRGLGLMVAIELRQRATPFLKQLLAQGVLALPAGPTGIRLLPPLVITRDELDVAVDTLGGLLSRARMEAGR